MNEKPEIEVGKLPVITKFIYTLGVLPSSYLMSMTYQEQVTWLYNYLQTQVIPLINTESAAIQELQTLYELLRTYVNDYFDNLDVQEEINNKLNEMAEDGSLLLMIKNYVDPIYQAYEERIDREVNDIQSQVDGLSSGAPLPASSTSLMTDTTKLYVNTTDGYVYYYDGTQWVQGWVYQATEDSDTLSNLEYTVSQIGDLSPNLFIENDDTKMNGYYSRDTETNEMIFNSDNTFWCGIVKLDGAGDYTLSSSGYNLYRLDADKKWISTVSQTGTPKTITCSDITKYLAFSCKKTRTLPDTFMVVKSDTLPESYIKNGFILKDNISLTNTQKSEILALVPDAEEKYIVSPTDGDYTGIIAALTDLQGNTNKKTIIVMPGIYDIFEEYGGSTWHLDPENQNKGYHDLCPFVPENTTIMGIGEVTFRYRPTSNETTHYMTTQVSPINIEESVTIKNINFDCDYCRYAIHIETGSTNINKKITLENLRIVKSNSDGFPTAIGCGGTTGLQLIINNCYVKGAQGAFSIHDNGTTLQNGMNIYLKDSTFVKTSQGSTRNTLRFSNINQTNIHNVYINNSYFTDLKLAYETGQSGAKNGYKIIVSNCSNYDIKYNYEYDNDYVIDNYNTTVNSITNEGTGQYN